MVKVDTKDFERAMDLLGSKSMLFALKKGLDETARVVRDNMRYHATRTFEPSGHGAVPYTLRSIVSINSTTENSLTAKIKILDESISPQATIASKYLYPQVHGGERRHKRFENSLIRAGIMAPDQFAVPTGMRKDSYGNVTGQQIVKVLSSMKAFDESGWQMNATSKSQARNLAQLKRRADRAKLFPMDLFAIPDNGIFARTGKDSVKQLFAFTDQPLYNQRWEFEKIAEGFVLEFAREEITKALMTEIIGKIYRIS